MSTIKINVGEIKYPYVVLPSDFLRDPEISLMAKGLLALLLTDPTPENPNQVSEYCTEGDTSIRNAIKELIAHGYMDKKTATISINRSTSTTPINPDDPQFQGNDTKPGKLPQTIPSLVPHLTDPNPAAHIQDTTTEEDLATCRAIYPHDSWQYKYSDNLWRAGHQKDFLTVPQWLKKELVLQQWADDFDKVIRTGKGTMEHLQLVMRWMFGFDDFWLGNGFQSPAKFHQSDKKGGNRFFFDRFLTLARKSSPKLPVSGFTYTEGQRDKIMEWYPGSYKKEWFKKSGDKMYTFVPEEPETEQVR